jgi:membrane protein insertase Oxa1/YidC/SpoIIIJ
VPPRALSISSTSEADVDDDQYDKAMNLVMFIMTVLFFILIPAGIMVLGALGLLDS